MSSPGGMRLTRFNSWAPINSRGLAHASDRTFSGLVARLNRLLKNAVCWRNVEPQRLKPDRFSATYGMPEGIP